MITMAVLDPDAFTTASFLERGTQDQVAMLFRGIESNGVLFLDSDGRLLDELENKINELPDKYKQDLRIRLEWLRKKEGRGRLIKCRADICNTSREQPPWERAQRVATGAGADAVFAALEHCDPWHDGDQTEICPLSNYASSRFEEKRRWYMDSMPNADKLTPSEFDEAMARVTRFSRWVRFFDKQIGKGTNPSNFRRGIERVLNIWKENSHFPPDHVEIVTVVDARVLDTDDEYAAQRKRKQNAEIRLKLDKTLVAPLQKQFRCSIRLSVKATGHDIFRNRYLQTEQAVIHFSEGFDLFNDDESPRDNIIQVRNQDRGRLDDLRRLPDYAPTNS